MGVFTIAIAYQNVVYLYITKKVIRIVKIKVMNYTAKQIENAKRNYNDMLRIRSISEFNPEIVGTCVAEQRCEYSNTIVRKILNGDVALANEWKLFFLNEEVKRDQKNEESKAKLSMNKKNSFCFLAQIKENGRKLGDYYSFVKSNKKYAREFFSKNFTQESVNAFLAI